MSSIDEIKARIDIVDLVSETVQLRRSGKNYTGFCPFHPNTRTPAFVVFPDSGTWRCFGQCNEGGDIFRFVMKKEGWDFPQTLHYLAEKAGVVLEPLTPQRQAEEEEHEQLHALLEEAVTFYRYHLLETAPGQAALAYLEKRGLTPATIEAFGLGYAPDTWDAAVAPFQPERLHAGRAGRRPGWSPSASRRRGLRPLPQPHHHPHPRRGRQNGRVWRAHPQPGRPAQIPQLAPDGPVRQGPPALRPGPGAQAHPRRGPGGDRRGLPGRDRPAPGRFHQRRLAHGHRPDRGPAAPAQTLHPPHRPGPGRRTPPAKRPPCAGWRSPARRWTTPPSWLSMRAV